MSIEIPWIGFKNHMEMHSRALNEAGYSIMAYYSTSGGLDVISKETFPLIIVQYWLNDARGLDLSKVDAQNPGEITCQLIRTIRDMPEYSDTPIIVPHEEARDDKIKPYLTAGATKLVDVLKSRTPTQDLVDAVKSCF